MGLGERAGEESWGGSLGVVSGRMSRIDRCCAFACSVVCLSGFLVSVFMQKYVAVLGECWYDAAAKQFSRARKSKGIKIYNLRTSTVRP